MRKRYCIVAQIVLLLWFFLDMTGLYFGNKCLVTRSYKEDGICFLIYLITIILFLVKENIQLMCHEWYTIFNSGFMGSLDGKIKYFSKTIHWIDVEGKYIPDVYHTILHILILCTLTITIIYSIRNRRKT